jgi:hypothetical protein
MLNHAGWKRAWVMISGGILILMVLLALNNPNVVNVSGSSWDCVPGTYSESTSQLENGFYQPDQAQVEDQPGQIITFSCTSYLRLIFAFVAAALLSIGIAMMFRLVRWMYGFRKT